MRFSEMTANPKSSKSVVYLSHEVQKTFKTRIEISLSNIYCPKSGNNIKLTGKAEMCGKQAEEAFLFLLITSE